MASKYQIAQSTLKAMSLNSLRPGILALLALCAAVRSEPVPTSTAAPLAERYLTAVRLFADQALVHGRDVYGKSTPLFVDGINVSTLEPTKWKWADGEEWVLCNVSSQQGLFRTLDGLSRLTGDSRYREAAKEALRYAFDHLRYGTEHNGGLLAWGGHLAYDASNDVITGHPNGTGRIHELKAFFPHYELMWEVDSVATRQLIENTWNGHILDWSRLDFNRHGSPKPRGALWRNVYQGGEVFFWGGGLTFHNAAADYYYAAAVLSKLSGASDPLVWAKRLSRRYVETRDPKTGLEGFVFSQSAQAWCDDQGTIRGDRAQFQYGDYFKGHRVFEGTLFPYAGRTPDVRSQAGRLLVGEMLGESGRDFRDSAVEALTAWGKFSYRQLDNAFVPMLTDGTSMEGFVVKKDGYFGPKGRVLLAGHPGAEHFWLYTWAFRQSGDRFLWEMARHIAAGNKWGDIGKSPVNAPALNFPNGSSDPYLLVGFLDLYRSNGQVAFREAAQAIADNILKDRRHAGWFVPTLRHTYSRLANNESQALLQLAAVLLGKPGEIPVFVGESPFFHAAYGEQPKRVYDSQLFYRATTN